MLLILIGLLLVGLVLVRVSGSGFVVGIIGFVIVGFSMLCIVDFGGEEVVIVVDVFVEIWMVVLFVEFVIVFD